MQAPTNPTINDELLRAWKLKKLLDSLDQMKGHQTSLISLFICPTTQIPRVNTLITEGLGSASCIKQTKTRNNVQEALRSIQARIKMIRQFPANGVVIYCGVCTEEDGRERKMIELIEPPKPISHFQYLCDSRFHTDPIREMLNTEPKYGYIVMDGNGTLFATVAGTTTNILGRYMVSLPKKHSRGGQSSVRFARLRF